MRTFILRPAFSSCRNCCVSIFCDTPGRALRAMSAPESTGAPIEDRLAVRQALLALPLEQRAAVTLCLVSGYSHLEASAIMGVALGTVKSHVSRGRERLRRALEGES